jgi:choline dehydrogenase-like flavoprotein
MTVIDTDYLVIGAGAAGMAFADSLIAESDADVVMVDRRHRPGGHWNDAYPFVRLHQPSAFYGVNSRVLGTDSIDEFGPNAGLYGRSTAAEICDYHQCVLDEHLLQSGRVRFFGMCDYLDDRTDEHQFVSRLTGDTTTVRVRRKVVDATYLETACRRRTPLRSTSIRTRGSSRSTISSC